MLFLQHVEVVHGEQLGWGGGKMGKFLRNGLWYCSEERYRVCTLCMMMYVVTCTFKTYEVVRVLS